MANDEPENWFVVMVFTEEMQARMERLMKEAGYYWLDFKSVDLPDLFQFPFQVRYTFQKRPEAPGDEDYDDWAKGDSFVHYDDPYGERYVATGINHEDEYIHFIDKELGEVVARFSSIRRVRKAER